MILKINGTEIPNEKSFIKTVYNVMKPESFSVKTMYWGTGFYISSYLFGLIALKLGYMSPDELSIALDLMRVTIVAFGAIGFISLMIKSVIMIIKK
jgi:hypothetical protein